MTLLPAHLFYLYFSGEFMKTLQVYGLGKLHDFLDVFDPRLLQLLADLRQLRRQALPERDLLQRATVVPRVHGFLDVQKLLDLITPVDHHNWSRCNN